MANPVPPHPNRLIPKYEYPEIVGIGIYSRRKGIVDFVELAKRLPEYKFIWFGSSPVSAATSDVKKALKESNDLPNIKFPGHVPQEMIREALGGCDLYL